MGTEHVSFVICIVIELCPVLFIYFFFTRQRCSLLESKLLNLLVFRQQWKSELNTYRVEAAWKLGKWDLLEDYLSSG